MAIDLNVVTLIGRLGQDPEGRYTPAGKAVTTFDIAVNDDYRDAGGELVKRNSWIRIETWGRLAEVANEYLRKSHRVAISGKLQIDKVAQDNGGNRYYTKVVASTMQMLSSANGAGTPVQEEEEPVLF